MSVERIRTRDGLGLAVEHHQVAGARAKLTIVHGYLEHRGRYAPLVERLSEHGIECHLFDLRGHGESEGNPAHVPRFADYVDDLDRFTAAVRLRGGSAPMFLLGHSLGGLIALMYVRMHPDSYKAIAVSSPFLGPAFQVPWLQEMLASVGSVVAPELNVPSTLDPKWISRDRDVVAEYVNDPRVLSKTTPRWFIEIKAAQRELVAHASEITTPALFLVAEDDRIADHRVALDVFDRLGTPAADKELHTQAASYHEVFNEISSTREQVIRHLLSWLDERVALSRSAG